MPPAPTQPFPFLDLPKDIRLIIYDSLPTTTRHHTIHFHSGPHNYSLSLLTTHITGLSLLRTCTLIASEAVCLQRKIHRLRTTPLRMIMHWRAMGQPAMRAILRCVGTGSFLDCKGSEDLDEHMYSAAQRWDLLTTHSDVPSHFSLHAVLRRVLVLGGQRQVEIAVQCTHDLVTSGLFTNCLYFYSWLMDRNELDAQDGVGGLGVHINLRPVCESEREKVMMELDYALWVPYNPPSKFRGEKWSYELGEWVERGEWEAGWEEGVKF